MYRILIADGELSLVSKVESFLAGKGYKLVGCVVSGEQLLKMVPNLRPDLILMETRLSGSMDGIEVAKRIRRVLDIPIVFVTWDGDDKTLRRARDAYPSGYVLKPFRASQIQVAIELAMNGKVPVNGGAAESPSRRRSGLPEIFDRDRQTLFCAFTPAEIRVAHLIREGRRSRDIARRLELSAATVDWHRKNIRRKMGLKGKDVRLMPNLAFLDPLFQPVRS